MDVDEDSAKVRFPPPFIYLGLLLLGLAADRILPWSIALPSRTRIVVVLVCAMVGLFVMIAATGRFRSKKTDLKPWKSTRLIVDDGIYGFSRNPMYLGMILLYAAFAFGFSSLGAFLLLPVTIFLIRTQVIAREERYLEAKFGDSYRTYKTRVRRWL